MALTTQSERSSSCCPHLCKGAKERQAASLHGVKRTCTRVLYATAMLQLYTLNKNWPSVTLAYLGCFTITLVFGVALSGRLRSGDVHKHGAVKRPFVSAEDVHCMIVLLLESVCCYAVRICHARKTKAFKLTHRLKLTHRPDGVSDSLCH
jgi:hypothetical protein